MKKCLTVFPPPIEDYSKTYSGIKDIWYIFDNFTDFSTQIECLKTNMSFRGSWTIATQRKLEKPVNDSLDSFYNCDKKSSFLDALWFVLSCLIRKKN